MNSYKIVCAVLLVLIVNVGCKSQLQRKMLIRKNIELSLIELDENGNEVKEIITDSEPVTYNLPETLYFKLLLENNHAKKKFKKLWVDLYLPNCFVYSYNSENLDSTLLNKEAHEKKIDTEWVLTWPVGKVNPEESDALIFQITGSELYDHIISNKNKIVPVTVYLKRGKKLDVDKEEYRIHSFVTVVTPPTLSQMDDPDLSDAPTEKITAPTINTAASGEDEVQGDEANEMEVQTEEKNENFVY